MLQQDRAAAHEDNWEEVSAYINRTALASRDSKTIRSRPYYKNSDKYMESRSQEINIIEEGCQILYM
jgi:hypothetical protein